DCGKARRLLLHGFRNQIDSTPNTMRTQPTETSVRMLTLATVALLGAPAFSLADTIYVALGNSNTILKYGDIGGPSTVFTRGIAGPQGMAFDAAGNMFAASSYNDAVVKFTPAGVGSTFATLPFADPHGLAFDSSGNLYSANRNNGTITKLTP